jgi:hypothetical protein
MQFASISRELTEVDLSAPCAESETRAPQLERLKTKHHQIARLIADGLSDSQVCAAVGVTPAWLSTLKADALFAQLVANYRDQVEARYLNTHEYLAVIAQKSAAELIERLEETPQEFDLDTLQKLIAMAADRTGHAPQTKSANVQVTMNIGERLALAQQRLIEGSAKEVK